MKIWMNFFYHFIELRPLQSFWILFEKVKYGQVNLSGYSVWIHAFLTNSDFSAIDLNPLILKSML